MPREGHNRVFLNIYNGTWFLKELSSIVNVLGQQSYSTTRNYQCLVLNAIICCLYQLCLPWNDCSGTKTATEVKAKATKCRSQLTTVMCHKNTMVNIAIVHVVYFYITFFPYQYSRQHIFQRINS